MFFDQWNELISLILNIDTSKVKDMSIIFYDIKELKYLNTSS